MNPLLNREEKLKSKQEHERLLEKQAKLLRTSFKRTFGTRDGKIVLQWIMKLCGWDQSPICMDPTSREINDRSTLHDAARQNVYRQIRSYLTSDVLCEVEFDDLISKELKEDEVKVPSETTRAKRKTKRS